MPALRRLVLLLDGKDFVLELLLPLHRLLGRHLQLLHVLSDRLELVLDAFEVLLRQLCALVCSLELVLLDTQLPRQFVELLLVVRGHLGCLPQVFVVLLDGDLVVHALRLEHLDLLEDVVGLLGGDSQLGDGGGEVLVRLLGLLLHQHDAAGEGGHVSLDLLQGLLLLLEGLRGLGEFVVGLVELNFEVVDFLAIVADINISL